MLRRGVSGRRKLDAQCVAFAVVVDAEAVPGILGSSCCGSDSTRKVQIGGDPAGARSPSRVAR